MYYKIAVIFALIISAVDKVLFLWKFAACIVEAHAK